MLATRHRQQASLITLLTWLCSRPLVWLWLELCASGYARDGDLFRDDRACSSGDNRLTWCAGAYNPGRSPKPDLVPPHHMQAALDV